MQQKTQWFSSNILCVYLCVWWREPHRDTDRERLGSRGAIKRANTDIWLNEELSYEAAPPHLEANQNPIRINLSLHSLLWRSWTEVLTLVPKKWWVTTNHHIPTSAWWKYNYSRTCTHKHIHADTENVASHTHSHGNQLWLGPHLSTQDTKWYGGYWWRERRDDVAGTEREKRIWWQGALGIWVSEEQRCWC